MPGQNVHCKRSWHLFTYGNDVKHEVHYTRQSATVPYQQQHLEGFLPAAAMSAPSGVPAAVIAGSHD